jgi:hypothetical protein
MKRKNLEERNDNIFRSYWELKRTFDHKRTLSLLSCRYSLSKITIHRLELTMSALD